MVIRALIAETQLDGQRSCVASDGVGVPKVVVAPVFLVVPAHQVPGRSGGDVRQATKTVDRFSPPLRCRSHEAPVSNQLGAAPDDAHTCMGCGRPVGRGVHLTRSSTA
jgi:hypothetical protein